MADVYGHGLPDLVVANANSNNVSVLRGNGDGTFQTPNTVPTGGVFPISVAVADLNGDGTPDLVTANANSNNVSVLTSAGTVPNKVSQIREPV